MRKTVKKEIAGATFSLTQFGARQATDLAYAVEAMAPPKKDRAAFREVRDALIAACEITQKIPGSEPGQILPQTTALSVVFDDFFVDNMAAFQEFMSWGVEVNFASFTKGGRNSGGPPATNG